MAHIISQNITSLLCNVKNKIIHLRDERVIFDADIAELYGVKTKEINQAVRNNPNKFPEGYILEPTKQELTNLRSKFLTTNVSPKSRTTPKAFTEKGLYMLATILKGEKATQVTIAIIETFAMVREIKRELHLIHNEKEIKKHENKIHEFSEILSNIIMPDLETNETESSLEINFIIGKIKHTVKPIKKQNTPDHTETI